MASAEFLFGGEQEWFRAIAENHSATQGATPPVEKCGAQDLRVSAQERAAFSEGVRGNRACGGQLLGNPRKAFAETVREGAFVGEPLGSYHI